MLKMARRTLLQEIDGSAPRLATEGIGSSRGVPADQKLRQNMNKKTNGGSDKTGIGGIFRGLGNVVELLSNLANKADALDHQIQQEGQIGDDRGVKAVYGFSLRVGGAGREPIVQRFGNVKDGEHGATVEQQREPMVDVFDESDHVQLVAELPGVDGPDIRFELRHDVLELSAQRGDRRYHKEILLPSAVSLTGSKASYNNGIFELTLPKIHEPGPTGAE
jgi:HSP20 family protein